MRLESQVHDEVIRLARAAHKKHWRMSSDESTGDKLAAVVTADWQSAVLSAYPERFKSEQRVGQLKERTDLVDLQSGVAYYTIQPS